ncbi:MAG: hypothetical protein Q9220_004133 [cf. Caloplaca sp. 1 TL-2023]
MHVHQLPIRPSLLPFLHPPSIPLHRTSAPTLNTLILLRPASHASEGRANRPPRGPGKRLGCKKSSQSLVVPGNIIFRQRGTHWFPGEGCGMGRDHTIFAKEKGFVCFYRDPEQLSLGVGPAGYGGGSSSGGVTEVKGKRKVREKRKYIGVVPVRGDVLPRPRGVKRMRRLGMEGREFSSLASPPAMEPGVVSDQLATIEEEDGAPALRDSGNEDRAKAAEMRAKGLRPGYMYREANWEIGRVGEGKEDGVRVYQKGDRFLAWRKKKARLAIAAEKRGLRGQGKKKKGGK